MNLLRWSLVKRLRFVCNRSLHRFSVPNLLNGIMTNGTFHICCLFFFSQFNSVGVEIFFMLTLYFVSALKDDRRSYE